MLLTPAMPLPSISDTMAMRYPSTVSDKPSEVQAQNLATPVRIPMVSSQPILAASREYILVNECTKRKNNLILIDDQLRLFSVHFAAHETIIDALWCDAIEKFLLLTPNNLFTFDTNTKNVEILTDIRIAKGKIYKCFAFVSKQKKLLITYDEWETQFVDQWHYDKQWSRCESKPSQALRLTQNDSIGNIFAYSENEHGYLAMSVYNALLEQWRFEVRRLEDGHLVKAIDLPGSSAQHDYRMTPVHSGTCDTHWLICSQLSNVILAIDFQWQTTRMDCSNPPVRRMATFRENILILRTTECVDISVYI